MVKYGFILNEITPMFIYAHYENHFKIYKINQITVKNSFGMNMEHFYDFESQNKFINVSIHRNLINLSKKNENKFRDSNLRPSKRF